MCTYTDCMESGSVRFNCMPRAGLFVRKYSSKKGGVLDTACVPQFKEYGIMSGFIPLLNQYSTPITQVQQQCHFQIAILGTMLA